MRMMSSSILHRTEKESTGLTEPLVPYWTDAELRSNNKAIMHSDNNVYVCKPKEYSLVVQVCISWPASE
jgi:hypothetical protein